MSKIKLRCAAFSAAYYGSNSIYQGYISLYYVHLGFLNGQIGVIGAASAAAAMLLQPLWGMLGDRIRRRERLLCALSLAAAIALPAALLSPRFGLQIAAAMLFYAFFCGLLPLNDTILLETEGEGFGAYRMVGGVSFALMSLLFGAARSRLSAGGVLWCAAALLLLAALAALKLPDAPLKDRPKAGLRALLRDRRLIAMLAFVLPLQITMGFFYTFYAPRFQEIGGSDFMLGLGYLLATASEIPYLLLSGRIYRRFGAPAPMLAAAILMAARNLLLGLAKSPWTALLSQLLHGGGLIVVSVSMALWIGEHVPGDLRAGGQNLLNLVSFGLARIIGNLLGGLLARIWGRNGVFLLCAGICTAAAIAFARYSRRNVELLS